MSDNSEPNPTQTEVTSSEQLVGLVPIEGEDHNIGVQLISGDTDEDFFGTQAIELNGERHVIVSQAQDPETGELLLVLRGENGEHIAIQSEALSSMVQASGGDNIQVSVETQEEAALTLASDIISLSQSVSTTESNPMTTSLTALPSIIANIPSQTQQITAPTNVVQSIDTPRVSQEEQPSSISTITTAIPPLPLIESDQTPEPTTTPSLPIEKTENQEIDMNKEEVSKESIDNTLPKEENECKTHEIIPQKEEEESKEKIAVIADKDTNISERVSKVEELKEIVEPKEAEVSTKTDETEDKITEPKITVESVSQILETNEIPSDKKSEELEKTIDSNVILESTPVPEVTTTDTTLTVSSEPITSLSIPSTACLTTSLPTTLTTTSITSETIPSVSEEKDTTNTTQTVNSVPELGFGNTAVIQVQDSGNDNSLEQLMANAVLTADGNYVLMAQTEDGQVTSLPSELNLSDVISAGAAGGQTFLIETPEGLVACTAATSGEDGAIQLIPTETGDIEGAVISSAQSSGASVENQIIQAISGGQAMSYTFNSTSGCLELTAVNPTPTPTPPQKSSRGGRGSRSNKSKATPIPSMGQTLLLTTETDTPTVTTKPSTPSSARNRGGGGRGKGNKITTNELNSSDSTITSNTLQTKPISKTLINETLKSSTSVKGQTPESSAPPGPSQLAASRRTYSKKSNIVWITPDASQGANSTTFATVATASVKSKPQNQTTTTNSISSITKTTVETTSLSSRVRTPSPTKVTAITTATQSTSPTKTTSVTTLRSSSPIKTVSLTTQENSSLNVIKSIDSKTTNKPMVTTIANKSSPQITSNDKKDTTSKTTGDTTNTTTKIITASKTVASKSSVQSSPTKGQTPDLSTQSPVTSTETAKKTTIRVSDITATKTSVETSVAKTAAKTVVTVPSAIKTKTFVTKSTAPTIASTTTSTAKPTPGTTSSNKAISQSITKKSSIPTISTVSSVNKPITTTTTTSSTKVSTNIINSSDNKSSKIPQSVTTVSNESNVSLTAKQSKTSDSVKSVSNPIAVKSHVSSELSSTKSATNSSEKLNKKVSEKPVSNRNVETRHSARLSPTKSLKTDSNPKEIDSNPKVTQSSTDLKEPKVESLKTFTEKEVSKSELENESKTKTKSRVNDIESSSTQKTQKTEETLKSETQTQLESNESTEENKSIRKSRRSSRNISIVEENKKEVKSIEENKTIETKTKDSKEIKEKNIKEKIKEIPVESITTRRTSRKREVTNDDKPEETPIDSPVVVQTTVASTPTPSIEAKSQRQTRASSGKKPDVKQTPIEENLSKTVDIKLKEKETEIRVESKTESDFDRIIKETKPPEKTPEKSEPVLTKPIETTTSTRSVKKRVQFEIKEKGDEEENNYKEKDVSKEKVSKNLESTEKTPEMSASVSTRRSLRSSTPQTPVNPIKNDVQSNQKEVLENNTEKSEKQNIETNNKTPQRFSTRKRKEVTKSFEIEVKEVVKSPKKPKKSENDVESDVSYKKTVESSESPSNARLRDRKSKGFKPKSIMKETVVRHSIETSDPFSRINRKQSLIQSFIDENEWQEKEDNLRRKTISSLSDLRSPNECYDYSTNECSFYIRHQSASLTPKQSTGNYLCQKCGFHTTRINNLVIHHRDQCSYVKNAVIQHWQTELQKRVRPSDTSLTASTSTPETKRRKTEINDELNNNLDKNTDLSDTDESEDEEITTNNGKTNQNPTISDIDAMLMGSDDEDLLSIDNIEKPKREFGFSEDDIVWVETNSTHWPALVSKVFPKEKKALIRLIDSPWPKKSLKADISSISLFDSAEVNIQYLREGRKGVNGDVLVKAVQKAEEFLRKKCLGNELSAVKFFEQIDSDLSEANADEDERLTPNTKDNVSTDLAKETAKTSNDSTQDSSLVNDGSNGDDTEDDKMPESNEAIAKWKEKRRQQNAKLLQSIKDGKVETHLVGVYRESITSERHQKFKSGSDAEKNQLKHVPWFGPIDDEEQQEEIYDYCSQLFKANFKTDGSFDTVAYIFEVWVPEAIVKAISRVRRIELKESESIFAKGVILSQTEKDEMNKEIQKEAEKHMTSQTSSD